MEGFEASDASFFFYVKDAGSHELGVCRYRAASRMSC